MGKNLDFLEEGAVPRSIPHLILLVHATRSVPAAFLAVFGACRLVGCRPSTCVELVLRFSALESPPSLGIVRTYFYIHYSKIPGGFQFFRRSALLAYRSILVKV